MVDLEKVDYGRLISRFRYSKSDMEPPVFSKREDVISSDSFNSSPLDIGGNEFLVNSVRYLGPGNILPAIILH